MTTSQGKNAPKTIWTKHMVDFLLDHYSNDQTADIATQLGLSPQYVYGKASRLGLKKSAQFYASPLSGRTNGTRGDVSRFKPGHITWNKGKKYTAGGRSGETRFKKGMASANQLPVGHIRINTDGYRDIKVAPGPRNWVQLHRWSWKQLHGEYPNKGMTLFFKDGDKLNCEVENLELISRSELMKRNSVHNLPKELADLVQLRGALNRKINLRSKNV